MKIFLNWIFPFLVFGLAVSPSRAEVGPISSAMSFNDAINEIMHRSTDILAQRDQLLETRATNITARTAFLPNLGVQLNRYAVQDNSLGQRQDRDSINLAAKLNLFRFGADVKGWEAANSDEDSQTLKLEATVLATEQLAVQGLVNEIQGLLETEVLTSIVKKEQELLNIGSERYKRGLLPQQEVDKIQIDMENASSRLADTQVKEAVARANLVSLLGHDRIRAVWPWMDRFRNMSSDAKFLKSLEGSEEDLSRRPDVKSALSNSQAQSDRASQRVRQALPTLDSSFVYSSYGLIVQPAGDPLDPIWTAQLTISIPLFDQLTAYSAAKVQYYEEQKADVALELARRSAMADWSSAKSTFSTALTTALAREKTVQISRKLYSDSRSRFRLGRIDANDLSLDESRLSDSELLATAGWAQVHLALTQLCHSRGLSLSECIPQ
jgi:outer membrane protein TolC